MRDLIRRALTRALPITNALDQLQPLVLLAARLYVAFIFLRSGMIKLEDWGSTLALFHDEYTVPLLPPTLAAYVGTFGELFFPILIALGLAGRFGAAGLFMVNVMAVVSYPQLFGFDCPAGINMHYYWGFIMAALVAFGPGKISLDTILLSRLGIRRTQARGPMAATAG